MSRFTFRFGELNKEGTGVRPEINLDRISNKLEEDGIVGEKGSRKWGRKPIKGKNSVYFEFIKEISQEYPALSNEEEGEIVTEEANRIKSMHFLIFENGVYGFESRRGVYDGDALRYIFDDLDDKYDYTRFDSLDLSTMRDFYKESHEVRKFKAENIGEREPNPHVTDEELREITEDTGLETNSIIASVGRAKKNLKEVSLFDDGIAKYSDLPMIKSRDLEDNIRKLRDSGRLDFGVSTEDEDEEAQASEIRDTVSGVMRNLFRVDVSDDDDDD